MSIMHTSSNADTESLDEIQQTDSSLKSVSDDQQPWTTTVERLFHSYQRYNELRRKDDAIKERFNDLQTKLQELDVLRESPNEFCRTTTPSSRDSGVPIRSSSSSCCSLTSESASTPKSSPTTPIEQLTSRSPQTSILQLYLLPPVNQNHRHVSVHLNEEATGMSNMNENTPRYQSQGRNVHWNEDGSSLYARRASSQHIIQQDQQKYYNSDTNLLRKSGQRISLNASLPYDSKLNIRIHADRMCHDNKNEIDLNKVKATATIVPLNDLKHEQEHCETLKRNYLEHYSTRNISAMKTPLLPNDSFQMTTGTMSPKQRRESRRDRLPRHRQVSLPISLPVDQRLYLYIRNGEVLARC